MKADREKSAERQWRIKEKEGLKDGVKSVRGRRVVGFRVSIRQAGGELIFPLRWKGRREGGVRKLKELIPCGHSSLILKAQ